MTDPQAAPAPSPGSPSAAPAQPLAAWATAGPVVLVVLDGWGVAPASEGNAVTLADTPHFDRLLADYDHATLRASGPDVGLPEGQMGNSEVGHLTLGSGRIIDQDLQRIGKAVADGSLGRHPLLQRSLADTRDRGGALHLAGLLGEGGVHGHTDHLLGLVAAARAAGLEAVYIHAFTDGRDTAPRSALEQMARLEAGLSAIGLGKVATVCGRYWAMDRDRRWDRTEKAWRALRRGAPVAATAAAAIAEAYAAGETDEFIQPRQIAAAPGLDARSAGPASGRLADGDTLILWNFRADRMRQLLAILCDPDFAGFANPDRPAGLRVLTMTEYAQGQSAPSLFPPQDLRQPLSEVIAEAGMGQFHTAETEKYAHVTYFFNGGREQPFAGESHHLVPSPKVATYDLQPEMSAPALTADLVDRLRTGTDRFVLVNFANPDMVGHTGVLDAAVQAVTCVDRCLGQVLAAVAARGGVAIVTADHGNCEQMIDPLTGGPHTAHTLNPVPLVVTHPALRRSARPPATLRRDGGLRDIAPTVLELLGLAKPAVMDGASLLPRPAGSDASPTEPWTAAGGSL